MNLRQLARRVATLEALVIGIPPTPQDISQSELDYELERSAKDWQDIRDAVIDARFPAPASPEPKAQAAVEEPDVDNGDPMGVARQCALPRFRRT